MALAMHGPNGEYESVKTDEREAELRAKGWLNGHEFILQKAFARVASATVVPKPSKKQKA